VPERLRRGRAEYECAVIAQAPVHRNEQHTIARTSLHTAELARRLLGEYPYPVELTTVGEHRIHARERARRKLAVGGGDHRLYGLLCIPVERLAEDHRGAELGKLDTDFFE
jgi:hypothetical protein